MKYDPNISFQKNLVEAISDLASKGYVSQEGIAEWISLLRNAAERELGPDWRTNEDIRRSLQSLFDRFVDGNKVYERVPGVSRFTLQMIKPRLRAELDRRITASADLIKMHRQEAIERTLRRFQGWSTSIPPGGDETIDKREVKSQIGADLRKFAFEKRRVDIDQGAKLLANVADIVATEAGAIAGTWNSHWRDPSYNYRVDHRERDGRIYLIRDSWAHREGLVRQVHGYTDEITAPGQEVYCRCWYTYISSPQNLPDAFLTRRGQEWIERGKLELRRMA